MATHTHAALCCLPTRNPRHRSNIAVSALRSTLSEPWSTQPTLWRGGKDQKSGVSVRYDVRDFEPTAQATNPSRRTDAECSPPANGWGGYFRLLQSTIEASVSQPTPVVFVVDDDVSARESLELLIRLAGWRPETSVSAQEFLARGRVPGPSCLVLDVSLPGLTGLELQ
jgi:hypothetical protein